MFTFRNGPGAWSPGGTRGLLARWSTAAGIMTMLGLVIGALLLTGHTAGPTRPSLGAHGQGSGAAQVTLTIDSYVQAHIVEPTLAHLLQTSGAQSGTIVVERPSDGAIIAMASLPSHDPRSWQQVAAHNDFSTFPNPASSEAHAPGEPMKSLLTGIGFDTGSFGESTAIDDPGQLKTDGITIQNWCRNQCPFGGVETVADMLHYGSSIAATQFAKLIPDRQFYHYLDNLGFGQRQAGPGLPSASPGVLIEPYTTVHGKTVANPLWRPAFHDSTAFGGSGIATTPLQLANAYAVLANGGRLMQPHLVRAFTLGGKTTVIGPQVLHVVFQHSDTAQRVTAVLVKAAVHESCRALVPGYDVAAETGAAVNYNSPQTVASTVAYGPVGETDPAHRFVVLIALTLPSVPWGSITVAPVTGEILRLLFQHYALQPDPKHSQPSTLCAGPLP